MLKGRFDASDEQAEPVSAVVPSPWHGVEARNRVTTRRRGDCDHHHERGRISSSPLSITRSRDPAIREFSSAPAPLTRRLSVLERFDRGLWSAVQRPSTCRLRNPTKTLPSSRCVSATGFVAQAQQLRLLHG